MTYLILLNYQKINYMKTKIIISFVFLLSFVSNAQVGIGTTAPKASLDITSTNVSVPAFNDGLLIPRVNVFPATNPGADQNSMLVYLTTTVGTKTPGFYYWNNPSTSWLPFGSSKDAWELEGNTGIDDTVNFIGTTDSEELVFKTNNIEFTRLTNKGQFELSSVRNNIFIGKQAGENFDITTSTFGRRNIYIGEEAGFSNIVRSDNIAIGYQADRLNTLGSNSISIGSYALSNSDESDYSIAMGRGSLNNRTKSFYNVGLGHRTLSLATSGNYNTAVGADAGRTTAGDNSVYVGYRADSESSGNQNVVIGANSGVQNLAAGDPSGRVLIGYNVWNNRPGNNILAIENSSSITPLLYGEFDNNIVRVGGELQIGSSDDTTAGSFYAFPTADGTTGQVLTTDGSGAVTWENAGSGAGTDDQDLTLTGNVLSIEDGNSVTLSDDWRTTGNTGTNPTTNFLGTTDSQDLVLRTNNLERLRLTTTGRLEFNNTFNNIFIGNDAGLSDNLAFNHGNIAIGQEALMTNVVSSSNTAIGNGAMKLSTGLGTSVAFGNSALGNAVNGNNSVAIGRNSLLNNLNSVRNTAVGSNAIGGGTAGTNNTAIGYKAGTFTEENGSVFIGSLADEQNAGGQNVVIGFQAGRVGAFGDNLDGRVLIGYEAGKDNLNSNILAIENSSSATPLIGGDFANDKVGINVDMTNTANLSHTLTVNGSVKVETLMNLKPSSAPASPAEGDVYYDLTLKKVRVWTGATWENLN